MSQTANTVTMTATAAAADTKPKAVRKPALSEKYSKFLVCNYNLIKVLEAKELLTPEAVEAAYSEIKLLAPIEEQVEYYEGFLSAAKGSKGNPGIKSLMKKFVTQRNKPPKAPRAKKERKPKDETAAAGGGETKAKKERKPRAKKETKISDDTQTDVVAELVEAANTALPTPESTTVSDQAPGAPKKARKPRTKKADADAAESKSDETKAKKERKPRAKKEKPVEEAAAAVEEDEEIHTNEFVIDGKTYLIDSDNNLYDIETHEEVGSYDANTSSIIKN